MSEVPDGFERPNTCKALAISVAFRPDDIEAIET